MRQRLSSQGSATAGKAWAIACNRGVHVISELVRADWNDIVSRIQQLGLETARYRSLGALS